MTDQKVTAGPRLAAMILDHIIMTIIAMIFAIPDMISSFSHAFEISHEQMTSDTVQSFSFFVIIGISLYFCKDCINGRSVAKRILKLQVVDNKTGLVASPIKCFIRDIFCILWPVEVIVALINPSRRLGDLVAGTKLIPYDSTDEKAKPNYLQILISVVLSVGLVYLIMLPFKNMNSKLANEKILYIESSYNDLESKTTEKLFTDSLGTIMTSSIKIYDQVQNDSAKYISIITFLKQDYFSDEKSIENIKTRSTRLLLSKYGNTVFLSNIKLVYKEPSRMQTQTFYIDSRQLIK